MPADGRLFLAGATGVIGRRLIPLLRDRGWQVAGMTRSAGKASWLEERGVEPVVCDVFDRDAVAEAVRRWAPAVVVHQLTDLPDALEDLPGARAANGRIRTEGTRNLVDAARSAGTRRLLAQSIAWEVPEPGRAAVSAHEQMVLDAGGVVVRYGQFHGPGTYYEDVLPDAPRVHVDHAARRTVELLDAPAGEVVVVVDPDPDPRE